MRPKCGNCNFLEKDHCCNPSSCYCGDEMSPEAEVCREFVQKDEVREYHPVVYKDGDTTGIGYAIKKAGMFQLANGVFVNQLKEGDVLIDNDKCQLVITSVKKTKDGQEIVATSIPKGLKAEVTMSNADT